MLFIIIIFCFNLSCFKSVFIRVFWIIFFSYSTFFGLIEGVGLYSALFGDIEDANNAVSSTNGEHLTAVAEVR